MGITDSLPDSISWLIGIFREVRPRGWRIHADKPGYEDRQIQGACNRLHDRQCARDLGQGRNVAETDSGERAEAKIEGVKKVHAAVGMAN